MLRWRQTSGAMVLGILGGISRLGGGTSSPRCSFWWVPAHPGLKSCSSYGGLYLHGRFSLSPWPAGPPVSGLAEWSEPQLVCWSFLSWCLSGGHSSGCEAGCPSHQCILDHIFCTESSTPDFSWCTWIRIVFYVCDLCMDLWSCHFVSSICKVLSSPTWHSYVLKLSIIFVVR